MDRTERLTKLLDDVQSFRSPNVFNPWGESDPLDSPGSGAAERLSRLIQHFDLSSPLFILVAQCPGHKGCRFSGVPLTSEKLILDGKVPRVTASARFTTLRHPSREGTATMTWEALHELNIAGRVVLWNAFAWHPFDPGEPNSNRDPSPDELERGRPVLSGLLQHFQGVPVVPVGRDAETNLKELGVDAWPYVRHPANGGKAEFRSGLQESIGRLVGG